MMDRDAAELEWRDRYRTVFLKIEGKDKGFFPLQTFAAGKEAPPRCNNWSWGFEYLRFIDIQLLR
jgi:hypothetical protein